MARRIIFFTKYTEAGSSSRYRSFQYFPYYENANYHILCKPLFSDKYIRTFYGKGRKPVLSMVPRYLQRFFQVLFLKKNDIVFIEYELFPFVPFFMEKWLLKGRRNIIFDYDDARFHIYDRSKSRMVTWLYGDKIYKLVRYAEVVITGSPYLTEVLSQHAKKVVEIPTSILFEKYNIPAFNHVTKKDDAFRVGWIGSKTTSENIAIITCAIKSLQQKYNLELVLIGFDVQQLAILEGIKYRLLEWDALTEVQLIHSFDVGVMPLADSDFNKGKCGFKLIQYMACGIPTISTPVIANININRDNKNLFAVSSLQWQECFEEVMRNAFYYKETVGERNKTIVKKYFSVESNYSFYLDIFKSLT